MARGKVVRWKNGTGHIRDSSGVDYFFGDRDLIGLLPQDVSIGLEVEFVPSSNQRGPVARDVRRVGSDSPPRRAAAPVGPRKLEPEQMSEHEILSCIPVPRSLRLLLDTLKRDSSRHPGLMLDRFLQPCPKQEQQRDVLNLVAGLSGDKTLLDEQFQRRKFYLQALNAKHWSRTTEATLTLHLARANALENAGLCLHPIYGFAYLPGTGLKGMARAFAETVWLPAQSNKITAWQQIERVFGWAPGSDEIDRRPKPWKPQGVPKHTEQDNAAAGTIVFHDGWPEKWPSLLVDIVNNHYPDYYQGTEPPGDWQSPNPVYFLAIKPNTTFYFALSKRRADVSDELLTLAQQWLDGALTELGCGAKTAAGYGGFKVEKTTLAISSPTWLKESFTLELVTPAYLAGASQNREDCDLRSATLRGLLRWWWRTMHAGFVPVSTLRDMEAAVWGDTKTGGAVQVRVTRLSGTPILSPYKAINQQGQLRFNEAFAKQHHINPKGIPGLAYAGYGMDEMSSPGPGQPSQRRQRWCMQPGAKWRVELSARPGLFLLHNAKGEVVRQQLLPEATLLDQAKTALWWFCTLGGAGSKSRKGFGSFALPIELATFAGGSWLAHGKRFRAACQLPEDDYRDEWVNSPSLRLMRRLSIEVLDYEPPWIQVPTNFDDPWRVLDLIGRAMMGCAQSANKPHGKHREAKRGLGLPRKIHGPQNRPMRQQRPEDHLPPLELDGVHGDRHSSPVLFHVSKKGKLLEIHVAGFPTADLREPGLQELPGLQAHQKFLKDYLSHLHTILKDES